MRHLGLRPQLEGGNQPNPLHNPLHRQKQLMLVVNHTMVFLLLRVLQVLQLIWMPFLTLLYQVHNITGIINVCATESESRQTNSAEILFSLALMRAARGSLSMMKFYRNLNNGILSKTSVLAVLIF
jgi:hypothetical protein